MIEKKRFTRLRDRLIARRDALFDAHRRLEAQRRSLAEPEPEFEETSQKESLADAAASLDEMEEREVEALDRAIARIEVGEYPVCASCGRRISMRRLEAIPWTEYCGRCARQREGQASGAPGAEAAGPASSTDEGLPDAEEIEAIFDELREDGGVDTNELRIALREGSIHLEGVLPTEAQHQRLLEVIEDHLGLELLVDEIVINPLPWEREDRAPGVRTIEDVSAELMPEEEDLGPGAFEARRTGTPLSPPETLEPEER